MVKVYEVCEVCLETVTSKGFASYCNNCECVVEGYTLQLTEEELSRAFELDENTEA